MTILPTLFAVVFLALGFLAATEWGLENKKAFILWVITSSLVALSPLVVEYPAEQTPPISFSTDGTVHKHPYGMLHSPFAHKSFSRLPENLEPLVGSVTVITNNPKARTISYTLEIEVVDLELFFSREERRWPTSFSKFNDWHAGKPVSLKAATDMNYKQHIDGVAYKPVVELMYKFNNSQSLALSKFYNPAAESQQEEFKLLVEGWFNPRLEGEGLRVTFKSFSVE